jgi:hypothetical protein
MVVCRVYVFSSPMDFKLCISIMLCLEAATPEQRPTHHTRVHAPRLRVPTLLSPVINSSAAPLSNSARHRMRKQGERGGAELRLALSYGAYFPLQDSRLRSRSSARSAPPAAPPRNGLNVTDAVYNTRSSIRRVPEHPMVPAKVCDGQDPARSTSCRRDIDTTLLPPRGQTRLRVTV